MTGKYQLTRTADGKITTFRTGEVLEVKNGDEAWVYYVEETEPPEGYGKDGYGTKNTTETGTTITKAQGATTATNGGVIMNRESSGYELPQTGGIGTTLFTALGGLMTVAAGVVLTLKSYRRRKQNT